MLTSEFNSYQNKLNGVHTDQNAELTAIRYGPLAGDRHSITDRPKSCAARPIVRIVSITYLRKHLLDGEDDNKTLIEDINQAKSADLNNNKKAVA